MDAKLGFFSLCFHVDASMGVTCFVCAYLRFLFFFLGTSN